MRLILLILCLVSAQALAEPGISFLGTWSDQKSLLMMPVGPAIYSFWASEDTPSSKNAVAVIGLTKDRRIVTISLDRFDCKKDGRYMICEYKEKK